MIQIGGIEKNIGIFWKTFVRDIEFIIRSDLYSSKIKQNPIRTCLIAYRSTNYKDLLRVEKRVSLR